MSSELRTEEVAPFMQSANQILNDLHILFFEEETVDVLKVEKIILDNLQKNFTRTRSAVLAGISVRTLRNKLNERV